MAERAQIKIKYKADKDAPNLEITDQNGNVLANLEPNNDIKMDINSTMQVYINQVGYEEEGDGDGDGDRE